MKKRVMAFFMAVTMALTSTTAYAHNADVYGGSYIGRDTANFVLRIEPTARTEALTYLDVYRYGTEWNGISSKVKLSVANVAYETPAIDNQICVRGKDMGGKLEEVKDEYGNIMYDENGNKIYNIIFDAGETTYYDKNGKPFTNKNLNIAYCAIDMNVWTEANEFYKREDTPKDVPRKVFLHEVGHALKLKHPVEGGLSFCSDCHGFPVAVMNQGFPGDFGYVSSTITDHDKSCLRTKWGE